MATTDTTTGDTVASKATLSGAKLAPIAVDAAKVFLVRLGETTPGGIDVALGGFESDGALIGVGVLSTPTASSAWAVVAVALERRRLKVGGDLLHALVEEAARRGVRRMRATYPARAAAAEALVASAGLVTGRRVVDGLATAVLVVPAPA